jgi:hypothetical protein
MLKEKLSISSIIKNKTPGPIARSTRKPSGFNPQNIISRNKEYASVQIKTYRIPKMPQIGLPMKKHSISKVPKLDLEIIKPN